MSQFTLDSNSASVRALFRRSNLAFAVSDFCVAEFVSAISQQVRSQRYGTASGHAVIAEFEAWVASTNFLYASASDIVEATTMLRRFDLKLRAPDAIHLAICRRANARLLSYDDNQIAAAIELGITLAE